MKQNQHVDYESVLEFQSETTPGVAFVLNFPSYGRKLALDRDTAEFRKQIRNTRHSLTTLNEEREEITKEFERNRRTALREIKNQIATLNADTETDNASAIADLETSVSNLELDQAPLPDGYKDRVTDLDEEALRILAQHYNVPRVRSGLVSISGLKINGADATLDTLISDGPSDLFAEILEKVEELSGIDGVKAKNSKLLSISSNRADGKTGSTIATDAGEPESIEDATAAR